MSRSTTHWFLNLVFRLATRFRQEWLISLMSRSIPHVTVGKTGDYTSIKEAIDTQTAWRYHISLEPGEYREQVKAKR